MIASFLGWCIVIVVFYASVSPARLETKGDDELRMIRRRHVPINAATNCSLSRDGAPLFVSSGISEGVLRC